MSANGCPCEDDIRQKWPLHWMVWNDDHKALDRILKCEQPCELELVDPRGRTPLHLAVTLSRVVCVEILLKYSANTLAENRHHWSVLNEAVCTGRPDLIGLVLSYRDQQLDCGMTRDIPMMLEKLSNAPDYYIEMKWEFQSWIPFVSRMCPSDTCKIWKKGTTVRVDTTLVGFERMSWQRGHQTLIFQATPSGHCVCDINHGDKTFWQKEFKITKRDPVQTMMSREMGVLQRMSAPVNATYLNTDTISFQRQKSGIWGFRMDRTDEINGYKAKVFSAVGLDIETRTRLEHLPETEIHKYKSISPLQDFLGVAQDLTPSSLTPAVESLPQSTESPVVAKTLPCLSMEEYFTEPKDKDEYDGIGRTPVVHTKVQKLKGNVCLAEDFPMSLQDHLMPIIDLMALNTPHFAKIKEFINMQMPSGFPIKFEIPLFHVMSAKVTFGNLNGHSSAAPHITLHSVIDRVESQVTIQPSSFSSAVKHRHMHRRSIESSVDPPSQPTLCFAEEPTVREREVCEISDECFDVPSGYRPIHGGGSGMVDQEEELLQMAIQQSLMDQEQRQQQLALAGVEGGGEKLCLQDVLKDEVHELGKQANGCSMRGGQLLTAEEELEMALTISREMSLEEERRKRNKEEDEQLERILKLSLHDK